MGIILPLRPSFDKTPVWVHVLCVSFFLIFGLLENLAVIYLFTRKANHSVNVYMVALAVLDIIACVFIAPQFPFMQYYVHGSVLREIAFFSFVSVILCYMYNAGSNVLGSAMCSFIPDSVPANPTSSKVLRFDNSLRCVHDLVQRAICIWSLQSSYL